MKRNWVYVLIFAIVIVSIILVSSGRFDFNNDGTVNVADLQTLASHYQGKSTYNSTFDLNGDSKVDLFDIVSEAKQINTSAGGGSSSVPIPPPVGSSNIVFDTRAGGIENIQSPNVTTFADALAVTKPSGYKNTSSGGYPVYPLDFVTNFDGNGTHAFRYSWTYLGGYNGTASSCFNAVGEENKMVHFNHKIAAGPLYIQWKAWYGRTATGGGYGNSTIGSFNHEGSAGGHKIMLIFRNDGTSQARVYVGYTGPTTGLVGAMSQTAPGFFENTEGLSGVHNLNEYDNQVVTFTLYVKPESGNNTLDGQYDLWFNNDHVFHITNLASGTAGYGEQQFGGPTFICPPQDQTQYQWDWVEWTPS